jgi:hypothetical protein
MKDKNKDKEKKHIQEPSPIMDGDTRPDKQEEAVTMERKPSSAPGKEKKLTEERGADIDSLEDFKDAK